MARQGSHLLESAHIPELDDGVPAARRQPAAVGGERHASREARRGYRRVRLAAGDQAFPGQVPQPQGAARVAGGEVPAVGRKGQAEHLGARTAEAASLLPGGDIPQADGAARAELAASRVPSGENRTLVPGVGMRHLPPGRHIPHPGDTAAGGQELAVGRERDPADLIASPEGAQLAPRGDIPEPDRTVGAPGRHGPSVGGERHAIDKLADGRGGPRSDAARPGPRVSPYCRGRRRRSRPGSCHRGTPPRT